MSATAAVAALAQITRALKPLQENAQADIGVGVAIGNRKAAAIPNLIATPIPTPTPMTDPDTDTETDTEDRQSEGCILMS